MRYLVLDSTDTVVKAFSEYSKAERFIFNLPESKEGEEIVFTDSLTSLVRYVLSERKSKGKSLYVVSDVVGTELFSSEKYQDAENFLFDTPESRNYENIVFRNIKTKEVRYRLVNSFSRADLRYLLRA